MLDVNSVGFKGSSSSARLVATLLYILILWINFRVLNISLPTYTMTIARTDFWNETCPKQFNSTNLNYTLFDYYGTYQNLTFFYGCSGEVLSQLPSGWNITEQNFTCSIEDDNDKTTAFYVEEALLGLDYRPTLESCDINVTLPVSLAALDELLQAEDNTGDQVGSGDRLEKALNKGFDVNYGAVSNWCMPCNESDGICGSSGTYPYNCFCPDDNKSYPFLCPEKGMFPLFFCIPIRLLCIHELVPVLSHKLPRVTELMIADHIHKFWSI